MIEKTCSGITRKGRRNRGRRAPRYQSVEAPKPPKPYTEKERLERKARNLQATGYAAYSLEEAIELVIKQEKMIEELRGE